MAGGRRALSSHGFEAPRSLSSTGRARLPLRDEVAGEPAFDGDAQRAVAAAVDIAGRLEREVFRVRGVHPMDRGCHRESMARRAATALPRAWRGRREQPRDVGLEQVLLKLGATGAFRW